MGDASGQPVRQRERDAQRQCAAHRHSAWRHGAGHQRLVVPADGDIPPHIKAVVTPADREMAAQHAHRDQATARAVITDGAE
jgi:hypothetical protein